MDTKKKYEKPKLTVINMPEEDVISTSSTSECAGVYLDANVNNPPVAWYAYGACC